MRQKIKQKQNEQMPDLLIPILIVICILPLVVHLVIYSCGYSKYDWYSENDILSDFYCCYKGIIFQIVGAFTVIILAFRMALYREKRKPVCCYFPLLGYGIFVILSTAFSVNPSASWTGNFESFENCLVLLFYTAVSFYAYQIPKSKKDYKIIWYGIFAISLVMIIIGMFQVFHHDLMNFPWIKRLFMSAEDYQAYGSEIEDTFSGNNVYLTLYNPNYAGIFLNLLFAVVFVMFLSESSKNKKIPYGIISVLLAVLTWYTYSRMSLITLILTVILAILKESGQNGRKTTLFLIAGSTGLAMVLLILDAAGGGKYLGRMIDKNDREPLERLITNENGISLVYGQTDEAHPDSLQPVEYEISIEDEKLFCKWEGKEISAEAGDTLKLPMEEDSEAFFEKENGRIVLYLADTTLFFVQEDGGYAYMNFSGKTFPLQDVRKADFHGLEYLGSARGYIWSRTLPLLKDRFLLGSGPDTYAEVFPQEDVAGKIVYADNPDRVIEKGHNDYLTKWVQTGGLSLLCLLVFYAVILYCGYRTYFKKNKEDETDYRQRIGFGCFLGCISFMVSSLANDSTLQTAPLFWVFAGISLACCSDSCTAVFTFKLPHAILKNKKRRTS